MRAVAISVWLFINLVFLGMCGYMYLLWRQYWLHAERQKIRLSIPTAPAYPYDVHGVDRCQGNEDPLQVHRRTPSVVAHKSQLVVQMRRVLLDEASFFAHDRNVCDLKRKTNIRTIKSSDEPFASFHLGHLFPTNPLFKKDKVKQPHFVSCAVVSSAGSLADAKLGTFIDAHDAVVRFNHAPTENFEKDVGTKTTLRIVNSQVVFKPEFEFLESPLYQNVSLLVWDPCNYTSSLAQWYRHPDFDLFGNYFSRRRQNPEEDLHLLDPRSAWRVWEYLQANVPARLRRNPPSSGFLEFVPSLRLSKRCHYFDVAEDTGCTFGSWHPLAAEKLTTLAMGSSDDNEVFGRGILRVQGYNSYKC
ncbi:hypothetical protein B566_EDAN006169 [Ephemera danica]|nr:hypothetical protein B566_EDAN006169 [Ephemera danica]